MKLFEVDTVVLPERATRGKGIGIIDLLDASPAFLGDHGVCWWIGSSGTFNPSTTDRVRRAGVSVSNLYGSSEVGLFAISCERSPGDFHVSRGCVLVEVVDDDGRAVAHGGSGRVVVTRLSGADESGGRLPNTGTQIFRLAIGDSATWISDPCPCGLTTPRVRDVQRRVASAGSGSRAL
jgi:hypothetical protein